MQRANEINWRLITTKRNKIKKNVTKKKEVVQKDNGTVLLSGILEENESQSSINNQSSPSSMNIDNDRSIGMNDRTFDTNDDDDDGSQCNIIESAYVTTFENQTEVLLHNSETDEGKTN